MSTVTINETAMVISLYGRLDKTTVSTLKPAGGKLHLDKNYQLNLEGIEHIDSAGLAYIVNMICRQQQAGGQISVTSCPSQLQQLIELAEVEMLFSAP